MGGSLRADGESQISVCMQADGKALIGNYKKAETDATQKGFKFVYFIPAGQTSLLQVQWEITLEGFYMQ